MIELDCHLQFWYEKKYNLQYGHNTDLFPPPPYPVARRGARVLSSPLLLIKIRLFYRIKAITNAYRVAALKVSIGEFRRYLDLEQD